MDPADVAETVDDESTAQAQTPTVSLEKSDADASDTSDDASDAGSVDEPSTDEAESAEDDDTDADETDADADVDAEESSDEESSDEESSDDDAAAKKQKKPVRVDTDEASARSPFASMALAAAVAALIAAIVCIGYFGYTGARAYTSDSARTELRDQSIDVAQQAALNITAIDPSDLKSWENRLKSSLTGDALKQANISELKAAIENSQAAGSKPGRIDSKIARSAVMSLDTESNSAVVLVFANVTATDGGSRPASDQVGFALTVVDIDGTRKVNKVVALNEIEFSDAGSGTAPAPTDPTQKGGN
ncbi:hypothetical protein ACH46_16505 [Gordonia phthalatica]|uniref:Mce-associated membrane protein n=1 Tax=Gordonia phthalatica TaxID=1136941 RepID=A0A0N9NDM3_9ACTN|nr:hypothetical protein ACH46_16505 [Gordonia phthalatica]